MPTMTDEQAETVLLAAQQLAITVRDEGHDAIHRAAQRVLRAAAGDPVAALTITAALIRTDAPIDAWWLPPLTKKTCSDCGETKPILEFISDRSRGDGYAYECRDCRNTKQREQRAAAA